MSLPKQVQQQADEVERLETELAASVAPPQDPDPDNPAPPPTPPEASVPEPTPPAPQPEDTEESWRQRYYSLQGMFNAEVPRLRTEVQELTNQLKTLRETQAPQPAAPQTPVSDKDIEAFGPELVDLMRRVASERTASLETEVTQLKSVNADLRKQLGTVEQSQGNSALRQFETDLTNVVPDWQAVNVDQDFLRWLGELDPVGGVQRQAFLNDAYQALDARRVANIFNAFKATKAPAPAPAPAPSQAAELNRQITPKSTQQSAAPSQSPNERIWSTDEIASFYKDTSLGKYRGREDEQRRIESEIEAAVSSGRLRE